MDLFISTENVLTATDLAIDRPGDDVLRIRRPLDVIDLLQVGVDATPLHWRRVGY
jgi:hypothetical protein